MKNKWVYPQEIVVWRILPFLRRELAYEMKKLGLKSTEIASLLGITKSGVSQYFHDKRALKIKINNKIRKKIKESAKRIIEKKKVHLEIQRLINLKETKQLVCLIHKKEFGVCKQCKICFLGRDENEK